MLFNVLLGEGTFAEKLLSVLVWLVALLPALTFHEWAHGFMAYKLGDETARADGRLSLNPLDHIDPVGALMIALVGFGWAKPVPVITRNFKKPKRDLALVSAAGPLANFVLAFISTLLAVLVSMISIRFFIFNSTIEILCEIFWYSAMINLGLGFFNLIPLPPLDGSNILMCLLPPKVAMKYSKLRYYSHYILLGVLIWSRLDLPYSPFVLLDYAQTGVFGGMMQLWTKLLAPLFGLSGLF